MWTNTKDELKRLETPASQAHRDRTARLREGEVEYYIDVARQMRAKTMAALLRKAVAAVARILHLGPASGGATPRTV